MHPHTVAELARARQIVEKHGCSSLAFLALLDDKSYYFSEQGSLIAYTIYGRVAVVLGDPIGPSGDAACAIGEFRSFCAEKARLVTFCPVKPDYLKIYQRVGFRYFRIGDEAVVDLRNFNVQGNACSSYRKRYYRLLKQGYQLVLHQPPLGDELLEKLRQISDQWLQRFSGPEKRFFDGWFDLEYIRQCRLAAIHSPSGEVIAFANLAPEYQLNGISYDLVRFAQACPPGLMDFFFVSLFFWAKEQGYDTFSIGGSELAQVGRDPADPAFERMVQFLYQHTNWFNHYKGLYDFKRKFHPSWEPRYLVYPGIFQLPAVCIAIVRIDEGRNFKTSQVNISDHLANKMEDILPQP